MARQTERRSKLEATSRPIGADRDADIEVIVKVHKPNYVPRGLKVRARITERMFTASVRQDGLQDLEDDEGVKSVAAGRPLRPAD